MPAAAGHVQIEDEQCEAAQPRTGRMIAAVVSGTLLNPLNSSMIAVALLSLRSAFDVSTATVTWVVSAYYLAGAVGFPAMGRLADQFGPRRVFSAGLVLVGATGLLAPLAPSFGWVVAARVLQSLGTSVCLPSGFAIFRATYGRRTAPANALGAINIAGNVSAGFGPVLGGFLLSAAGWPAIFLVNVPAAAIGFVLARRWLPLDAPASLAKGSAGRAWTAGLGAVWRRVDLLGMALFSAMLGTLLAFLLALPNGANWPLLAAAVAAGALLVWRELRSGEPFLDVRLLARSPDLLSAYGQFAVINLVFYAFFFGLPIWFEQARDLDPGTAGLLLLPVSLVAAVTTGAGAKVIERAGPRPAAMVGAVALVACSLLLLVFDRTTPIAVLAAESALLGIPTGFNNLALQAVVYQVAPANQTGAAGGQLQTFRYIGATLSTTLLAAVFGNAASVEGVHRLGLLLAGASAITVLASLRMRG